jgi:hypothetical protein
MRRAPRVRDRTARADTDAGELGDRVPSMAFSPPCRWSAPVESITIPSGKSAATMGAKRCSIQSASRSIASASADGSAS